MTMGAMARHAATSLSRTTPKASAMPPKMLLALPLVSALPAASTAFERPPKAAERAGSSATSALFLSRVSDSRQSSVSAAALPMVSLPPAIALAKSEYSKRPSRMAATMSGPARRPKTSAPIAMAAVADLAALIFSMYFGSAFCGSRPSLAKVLRANFMPVSTVPVFTPSRSHLASMAIESVKPKPMLRSGAPNSTTVCMRSPMPMPDCCVARKSMSRAPD